MKVAFVQIDKIFGLKDPPKDEGTFQVYANLLPREDGSTVKFKGTSELTCDITWNFLYEEQGKSAISIILQKVHRSEEVGRVTLPLSWFPKNSVVTETYPMISPMTSTHIADVIVKVHISENGECPFTAPEGKLLVKLARGNKDKHGNIQNSQQNNPNNMNRPPLPPGMSPMQSSYTTSSTSATSAQQFIDPRMQPYPQPYPFYAPYPQHQGDGKTKMQPQSQPIILPPNAIPYPPPGFIPVPGPYPYPTIPANGTGSMPQNVAFVPYPYPPYGQGFVIPVPAPGYPYMQSPQQQSNQQKPAQPAQKKPEK